MQKNILKLSDLGYKREHEDYRKENSLDGFIAGRVSAEHRERYMVKTEEGDKEGEILGNLRYTATGRSDFPVVGDWVNCTEYDKDKVLIHSILPRMTFLERQAAGKEGEKQPIAANIDYAFIVVSTDRDFSINRMERYLTICNSAGVKTMIIITKTDLAEYRETENMLAAIVERIGDIPVFPLSNLSGDGFETINGNIKKGYTYCLLGSSGVGKSTLLNKLAGKELMDTGEIGEASGRGRHITSHRELIVLDNGGIIIDNPGMRELGIADSGEGLSLTFDKIISLSQECKYSDCTHRSEAGCAVIEAVEAGEIDREEYNNYLRLEREKDHFEASAAERRQKDKDFGKMVRNVKKDIGKIGNKPDYQ